MRRIEGSQPAFEAVAAVAEELAAAAAAEELAAAAAAVAAAAVAAVTPTFAAAEVGSEEPEAAEGDWRP